MKRDPNSIKARILGLLETGPRKFPELYKELNAHSTSVRLALSELIESGEIVRMGRRRFYEWALKNGPFKPVHVVVDKKIERVSSIFDYGARCLTQ